MPLLLIELILVMQLPAEESARKMWTLGAASGFMVAFGYPGEVRDDPAGRWFYWSVTEELRASRVHARELSR